MLRKLLSGLISFALLTGCSAFSETDDLLLQSASDPLEQAAELCADFSGFWLGRVEDEMEGVAFSNPWGLILEQQGCEVSGKLALIQGGSDLLCEMDGTTLNCIYNAGEDCSNEVILDLEKNQLSGKFSSYISIESDVFLEKSSECEFFDNNQGDRLEIHWLACVFSTFTYFFHTLGM